MGVPELTIAVGLDGGLARWHEGFVTWWQVTHKEPCLPLTDPDSPVWWRDHGISDSEFDAAVVEFGEDGGYASLAPDPEGVAAVRALFDAGHDPMLVTGRCPTAAVRVDTMMWVAALLLPVRAVILGPSAKLEVEADILLDDDPEVVEELMEVGETVGILLDRPWNRAADLPRLSWADVPRVVSGLARRTVGVPVSERRWVLADEVLVLAP